MKVFLIFLALVVISMGGVSGYSLLINNEARSEESPLFYAEKAGRLISGKLHDFRDHFSDETDDADFDEEIQACLHEIMGVMFLEKSGSHFSRGIWGAEAVPYQFRNLRLTDPESIPLNTADRRRGIEQKASLRFEVEAYRSYERGKGWRLWKQGQPPHLDSLTLVREQGAWRPVSPPDRNYSLRGKR